jgi:hypothetical protein
MNKTPRALPRSNHKVVFWHHFQVKDVFRRVFSLKSQAGGIAVVIPWLGSAADGAAFPAGGGAAIGRAR